MSIESKTEVLCAKVRYLFGYVCEFDTEEIR